MINFDDAAKDKIKKHNPNWPQNPGHPDRIFIIGGLDQEKKGLLHLINHKPHTDEIYLYRKDPCEVKYQFLINKREDEAESIVMLLKFLLNTPVIWMIFIKILKNIIQIKNAKY